MPSTMRHGKPRIVVVSDRADASVEGLVSRLHGAGALVDVQSDVYAAMAMLAKGAVLDDVLVDVRSLDRRELGFLRLAPRYHAGVNFVVPILDGTEDRLGAVGGWLQGVCVEAVVGAVVQRISGVLAPDVDDSDESEILAESEEAGDVQDSLSTSPRIPTELIQDEPDLAIAEPQIETPADEYVPADFPVGDVPSETGPAIPTDEPDSSESAMDSPALSTGGGPDNAPEGPSLHEAVRMRMAGNGSGIVRRRKPPGFASPSEPAAEDAEGDSSDSSGTDSAYRDDSTISPEEMDALLTDEEIEGRLSLEDEENREDTNREGGTA